MFSGKPAFKRISSFSKAFPFKKMWEEHQKLKLIKDTLKAFGDFKNMQKSVWSNVFWYVKLCIFWKCIQYTIHWDKTNMLKKFPSYKINGTKNALFFLSRPPTHHSFTFNLRWPKAQESSLKNCLWYFPLSIPFPFY